MRVPIRLSAQLESTRIAADKQCAINMHPHSDGGYEQEPGLVEFAQYVEPQTNSDYTTIIDTQITTAKSHSHSRDGSKLYVLDSSGTLHQYSCSTAFGPPTSYDSESIDLTSEDSSPVAIVVRQDVDNTFYMLGANTSTYYAYLGSSEDLSDFSYAAVSVAIPSLTGTLTDFWTLDGQDWIFTTTSNTHHHTSGAYEAALTLDSSAALTGSEAASFNAAGTYFLSTNGQSGYVATTAFDVSTFIYINSSQKLDGIPAGTTANLQYRIASDTLLTMTGTNNGAAFYASFTLTDGLTVPDGNFRGGAVMNGVPYVVFGNSLFSFDSSGNWTPYSEGVAGSGTIVSDTDGTNLVLVTGAKQYRFRLSDGLTEINDSDINGCASTGYLDSTFYYVFGDKIFASDLADPTTVGTLNFISAESFTDDILRNFTLNQLHYSFGTKTIEIHYTSGVGNTRLSRQKVLEHGLIGTYAIDSIDDTIYFVDEQRRLSRIRGLEYAPIKIKGLGPEFESYSTVSDCIVNAFSFEQENFIDITFPTQDVTWRIHEDSGEVVKAEDTSGNRVRAAAYLNVYGDTYAVDRSNGKVYQFSSSNYQEDGNTITRTLYSEKITSEKFEWSAREFSLNAIYLGYDVSGSSAITVSVSTNSGATFENSQTITVNGRGIERLTPMWGQAVEFIFKVETTANAKVDILNMAAEPSPAND